MHEGNEQDMREFEALAAAHDCFVILRAHDLGERWEACFCHIEHDPDGGTVVTIKHGNDDGGDVYMVRNADLLAALGL